jgi:hypothetical protein
MARGRPERSVKGVQLWARLFALARGNLLSKGEDFNCSVMPTTEDDSDSGQESNNEFEHEL